MTGARLPDHDRLLARLVGPAEPELADAQADERVPGMRAHLQGCPACAEDHESLLALVRGRLGSDVD